VQSTAALLLLAWLLVASAIAPASHAAPPARDAAAAAAAAKADADATAWAGRYCTPTGCAGAPARPLAEATGFGAACLAMVLCARRRQA